MNISDENSREPVYLPTPVPPDSGYAGNQSRSGNLVILVLFILLLAGIGYVLILLPNLLSPEPPATPTPAKSQSFRNPPQQSTKDAPGPSSSPAQNQLYGLREDLYALKIQAEAENINAWAADEYLLALEDATRGNRYLNTGDYKNAADSYRRANEKVTGILKSKEARLKTALEAGYSALDDNNSKEAEKQFRLALALNPSEDQAAEGIHKTETLRQVTALLSETATLTDSGKLSEAEKKIEQLLTLDPENSQGLEKKETLRKQRAEIEFKAKMSTVFSSLKTGDLETASNALETLKSGWNTHPQFVQAEKILLNRTETIQIADLLKQSALQVQKEHWEKALVIYERILAIAPDALLALNGKKTAEERHRLDTALSETIAQPDRLQDIDQRERAQKLLEHALRVEPSGPKLKSQSAQLQRLLTTMSTPIAVTIISDNLTEITIYRFGNMGHFFTRSQNLTPGKYTIVGSRRGYRDVRKVIELNPETSDFRITVQCNEPI